MGPNDGFASNAACMDSIEVITVGVMFAVDDYFHRRAEPTGELALHHEKRPRMIDGGQRGSGFGAQPF
jgi:hypothetical protein